MSKTIDLKHTSLHQLKNAGVVSSDDLKKISDLMASLYYDNFYRSILAHCKKIKNYNIVPIDGLIIGDRDLVLFDMYELKDILTESSFYLKLHQINPLAPYYYRLCENIVDGTIEFLPDESWISLWTTKNLLKIHPNPEEPIKDFDEFLGAFNELKEKTRDLVRLTPDEYSPIRDVINRLMKYIDNII